MTSWQKTTLDIRPMTESTAALFVFRWRDMYARTLPARELEGVWGVFPMSCPALGAQHMLMHDMTDREAASCAISDQHPKGFGAPDKVTPPNDTLLSRKLHCSTLKSPPDGSAVLCLSKGYIMMMSTVTSDFHNYPTMTTRVDGEKKHLLCLQQTEEKSQNFLV